MNFKIFSLCLSRLKIILKLKKNEVPLVEPHFLTKYITLRIFIIKSFVFRFTKISL